MIKKDTSTVPKEIIAPSKKEKDSRVLNKGVEYFVNGKNEKAISIFNKSLKTFPREANIYCMRGEAYSRIGDKQKALADFNKAIILDCKNPNAFHSRGEVYLEMGDFKSAIRDFNKAMKIGPDFSGFYNSRGKAYFKMGNLEEALKDHCRAIKMDHENEEYSGAEACLYSSMIMFKKGNEKWAKQFFARAVKLDPTLILKDELWEFAKAGFFPALEYLYKSAKEARK